MRRSLHAWAAIALLFLAGCAGPARVPESEQDWSEHRARLDTLTHFTASGKIALRTPDQSESASLLWQQLGPATHLRLSGPMGLSATTVDSDGQQLEIRQGEQRSFWDLNDPELDLGRDTGFKLPLKALPHWLKGVPAPGLELQGLTLDDRGQLPAQLRQQGWTVDYESFETFDSYRLPTRLRVFREGTSARIILRSWKDLGTL